MSADQLKKAWEEEERLAHIRGWDFSHIHGRYTEEDDLPWDFREIVQKYRADSMELMDMDTGGGEFLLSLHHPNEHTAAIEGYPPNVKLCKEVLPPLGINFKEGCGEDELPFPDSSFDIITNRHGEYDPAELQRTLRPGGLFLTQQVGAENDRELVQLLLPHIMEVPYPKQYLEARISELIDHGFEVLESGEAHRPIRFYDVGALVWFARIIDWEFPGFSVESCLEKLHQAQSLIDNTGVIEGNIHRFYVVARKTQ
ncbi:class I SAM-dependent methyltransferase [Actinomyces sp. MRS3W]|uniref:class I SAM-dependent methyltransferase n=1 Tax=Actinomyces sp. MRS3W TaxID=2800796 RepID=UPI0028FD4656|nr:class I SAM-dependent methyltransferase [Actinomyces sp. MRS3W]MDU0347686.1 class I SAM-dependent methyltransferase [Actinomyces sp. MRS3W]